MKERKRRENFPAKWWRFVEPKTSGHIFQFTTTWATTMVPTPFAWILMDFLRISATNFLIKILIELIVEEFELLINVNSISCFPHKSNFLVEQFKMRCGCTFLAPFVQICTRWESRKSMRVKNFFVQTLVLWETKLFEFPGMQIIYLNKSNKTNNWVGYLERL